MQESTLVESQNSTEVQVREKGAVPYMLRLWVRTCRFLSGRSLQTRNALLSTQSCSCEIGSSRIDGYRQVSASPQMFGPSRIQSRRGGEFRHSPKAYPTDSGVFESPNGTSIIGVRVVNGKPEIVWGFDRRDLPWA
jgi:hypothetical protein